MQRRYTIVVWMLTLTAISSLASGEAKLTKVDTDLRVQDLANLADVLGVRFEIFDFEIEEPHCVHFFVDKIDENTTVRLDGHGLCGLAGPQRLTIQWTEVAGQVQFQFRRFRRDIEQGGSVSGPRFLVPEHGGLTEYAIESPQLAYDQETVLYHGAYGWNAGPRTEFKILTELRENPDRVIGTE